MWAAMYGQTEIFRMLIKAGADITARDEVTIPHAMIMKLLYAYQHHQVYCISRLQDTGVDIDGDISFY